MNAVVELSPEQYARESRLCCAFCDRFGDPQEWPAPVRRQLRKATAHCRKSSRFAAVSR
jgi:hypothetical protein